MKGIFISAGHSNLDSGAVGNGRKEADVVTEFRNLVARYLQDWNVPYGTDGKGSENWSLTKACAEAKKYSIAVEFHLNSASPTATGVETLSAPERFKLGEKLCIAVSTTLGIRNRGAKAENSGQHSKLAFVRAGGIILELFFITNKTDLAAYDAKKWLLARAVAQVLKEAYDVA